MIYLFFFVFCIFQLSLTAFFSGRNCMVVSHDLYHVTQAGAWPVGVLVQWLFKDGFPLCMLMASLIFLLYQFSSRSRIYTSLIEHRWPVFNLCSLTGDRGWQHDRCSLICVPSGLAVSPWSVGRSLDIGCPVSHASACVTKCKSCDMTVKFSLLKKTARNSWNIWKTKKKVSREVNYLLINNEKKTGPLHSNM